MTVQERIAAARAGEEKDNGKEITVQERIAKARAAESELKTEEGEKMTGLYSSVIADDNKQPQVKRPSYLSYLTPEVSEKVQEVARAKEIEKSAPLRSGAAGLYSKYAMESGSEIVQGARAGLERGKLEKEKAHADEMAGVYGGLLGSPSTTPEEKNEALEQKNRFAAVSKEADKQLAALGDKGKTSVINPYEKLPAQPDFEYYAKVGAGISDGYKNSEIEGAVTAWEFFTDEEKNTYNYLLAKFGETAAKSYWDSMLDTTQQRLGGIYKERIDDIDSGIGRTAAKGAFAMGAGVEQALGGFMQATTSEELPTSATQYGSQFIREELGTGGKILYDVINTTGNMLPSMLLSGGLSAAGAPAKLAKAIGSASMGLSAGGNTYKTALQEGMSEADAKAYARLVGASEGALGYALGGINKLSGGLGTKLAQRAGAIEKGFLRFIATHGASALSEATEEGLQAVLEPVFKSMVTGEDPSVDWGEVAYNALLGGITGGILGGDVETQQNTESPEVGTVPPLPRISKPEESRVVPPLPKVGGNESDSIDAGFGGNGDGYLTKEHHGNILDGIRHHIGEVEGMEVVSALSGNEFQKTEADTRPLRTRVLEFFNSFGNKVFRSGMGDIALNNAGVRDSLGHGYGKLKAATFAALPEVLTKGKVISYDPNFQGRDYESYLIAAPVTIAGERCYVGAYVIKDVNMQRYKVHEVLTINKDGTQSFKTEAPNTGSDYRDSVPSSEGSISQTETDYKGDGVEIPPAANSRAEAENTAEANRSRFDSWDAYWADLQRRKADASLVYDNATEDNFISARDAYMAVEAEERAAKRLKGKWESDGWTGETAEANIRPAEENEAAEEAYEGTEATERLGIKIASPITGLKGAPELVARQRAAYKNKRLLAQKIKELQPTVDEREFAIGLAKGIYTEDSAVVRFGNKIESMNMAKVRELADYFRANEGFDVDMLAYKRRENTRNEEAKAEELLANSDAYRSTGTFSLNFNTMKRNIRKIFGKDAAAINARYFDPVTKNSAERIRFINRMYDRVRKFDLSKSESELVQLVIEGTAVQDQVSKMAPDIREKVMDAAQSADIAESARDMGLSAEQRKAAEDYAKWLDTQARLQDDDVDAAKVDAAAKAYSEAYDDFYAATNDFLVSHGYEPIGYIKGYAPHMQPEQVQTGVAGFLKRMGLDASVTELPTEIAGRTADFKPGKQWNPYFQHRNGTDTQVDAVAGFESYVEYMSNVFYHTDDIQKLRVLSNVLRTKYSEEEVSNRISHAKGLYNAPKEVKLNFLIDENRVAPDAVLSDEEVNAKLDEYVSALYDNVKNLSRFGPLVTAIDDYTNKLAGKQTKLDRAIEEGLIGRTALNWGNRLSKVFGESTIVGNLSSALNQTAQLPMVQAELGNKYMLWAVKDIISGRASSLDYESDFLTGKMGTKGLTDNWKWSDKDAKEKHAKVMDVASIPFTAVDNLASRLIVRAAYLKNVNEGLSHEKAVAKADDFAEKVVGSRMQGARPMVFESKNVFAKLFTTFQLEVANTWAHISRDLNDDIRQTAETEGKKAAIEKTAKMLASYTVEAFLFNRLCEAVYGGTPAPLDLLGYVVGSVSKGFGETTNAFIANSILSVLGLDDEDEEREFDAEAALTEAGSLVVGDLPYVRNVASMAGYGDSSLPLPKLPVKTAQSLWDNIMASLKGEESDWGNTGYNALNEVTSWLPMGNQIKKTIQGIETVAKGGRYSGDELMYPVDTDGFMGKLTVAKAILFGNSALGATDAYYAADARRLSAKQTATYEALVEQGEDMDTVYDTIMKVRGVENVADSDADGKEKRDIIRSADMSDLSKAALYSTLIGEGQDEKFAALMDAGMSWDDVMSIYEAYKGIGDDESKKKSVQATEFAKWVDDNHPDNAELIKEQFKYWSMVPASASNYDKFTAAGINNEGAEMLSKAFDSIEPEEGDDQVSVIQKLRAIDASELTTWQKDAALVTVMSESQLQAWHRYDESLSLGEFIGGLEIEKNAVGKKDANGETIDGSEALAVMQGIDGLDLEDGEKQLLFEAMGHNAEETMWSTEYEGDDYETYYYLSDGAKSDYISWCSWMEVSEFDKHYAYMDSLTSDKDANGKAVRDSLQKKRIDYIDSLDLWPDEKTALFRCFYDAKSSLSKCPWYISIAMPSSKFPSDWK